MAETALSLPGASKGTTDLRSVADVTLTALTSISQWLERTADDMAHMSEEHIDGELREGSEQIRNLVIALLPCRQGVEPDTTSGQGDTAK